MKKVLTILFLFALVFNWKSSFAAPVSSCDTIINMTAIDTPEIFTFGPLPDYGYLAGNNSYGDEAKAEELLGPVGNNITGAYVFFSVVTINPTDSNMTVAVNVYDTTGTGGSPGNIIATTNVPLWAIAQQVTEVGALQQLVPTYVPFYNAPGIITGNFFIGVVLPQTTGDTVAIFSNSQTTEDGRGWEQWSDGSWNNWDSVYTISTPYHSGLYIAAITCPPAAPVAGIGVTSTTCAGSAVQFANQSLNGSTSWSWTFTGGSPDTSTSQNPSVTYATAGTYSVKLVATNGQGSDSITQSVVISANPSATVSITQANGADSANGGATVTGSYGSSYTYSWSTGGTGAGITNVVPGTYYVTITGTGGCQSVDTAVVTYITGIIQLNANQQVKIYPNPATDVLNLVWSQKSNAEVSVIDLSGNVLSTVITNGDMKTLYNIHNLASGAYILRITDKSTNQQQSMLFNKF